MSIGLLSGLENVKRTVLGRCGANVLRVSAPLPERSVASTASGAHPMASITTPIIPKLGISEQNAPRWCKPIVGARGGR